MANEFKIKKGLIVTGATSGTVVDVQGSQGQLFSVTDSLSGSIFAVSDISGVPILDVNSSGISYFDGSVGIGIDNPNSKLHVLDGVAGTYTPDDESDTLVIESDTPGGISLIGTGAGSDSKQSIVFGTTSDVTSARIIYDSNNSYLSIGTTTASNYLKLQSGNGVTALTLDAQQFATFTTRVGIGVTASTNAMLDVKGPDTDNAVLGRFWSNTGSRGSFIIRNGTNVSPTAFIGTAGGSEQLSIGTNNTEAIRIDAASTPNATFAAQAFSAATSSGDASSTLTTKGYVDGLITGATIYRGAWDPSGGGYGSPDLSGVTQTSGYYYICSADGTAEPNGTGTEPDSWAVGDWVIYNNVSGTGQWQKIDNSSVLSGVGTGQTVALWEGSASVTDSETLGNAPITVSGSDTTFAGIVAAVGVSSNIASATSGTFATGTAIPANQIVHVRDNVGQVATNSAGGIKISSVPGNDVFLLKRNDGATSYFALQNSSAAEFITVNMASGNATFAGDITSKGLTVDYTGNRTGDAGILVTNDSSDWGIKVDKDGTDDYGILSQTDGENAIVVRNAAGTNKIQLQGDGDATFAGDATIETGINLESGTLVIKNATTDTNGLKIFQDSSDASKIHNNYNGTLQLGVNNTTTLTLGSSLSATFAGDITQADGKRIWFRGSSASSGVGAQSYVFSDGLNLKIKGDDNVQILGDGGGTIAHFDYTGKVGIGTTLPKSQLQVAGGIQMADDTAAASADKAGTMRYRTGTEYVDVTGSELASYSDNNIGFTNQSDSTTISLGSNSYRSEAFGNTNDARPRVSVDGSGIVSGNVYKVVYTPTSFTGSTVFDFFQNGTRLIHNHNASLPKTFYFVASASYDGFDFDGSQTFRSDYTLSVIEVTEEDASYADMCMQTGSSTYEWVNIVRNTY